MKTPAQRAAETKRAYLFEDDFLTSRFLTQDRPMGYLQALAKQIWKQERIVVPLPKLKAGQGTRQAGRCLSYCAYDRSEIVFARHQRDVVTLLHELVHAMGSRYDYHDKAFSQKFFDLLVKYGQCDLGELVLAAGLYGIDVR